MSQSRSHDNSHDSHSHRHCHGEAARRPWYRSLLVWAFLISFFLLAASFFLPFLEHFRPAFLDYVRLMAVPILLGLVAGGFIDYYVPKEYISKFLAGHSRRTVFYSVGLGFLMSACSHGILALSMELHKKGASGPAVIAFLLASPWTNLPVTFLLIGFFKWKSLAIIGGALLVALITGFVFQILARRGWIEANPHTVSDLSGFSVRGDLMKRFRGYRFSFGSLAEDIRGIWRGIMTLADMVLGWILLGVVLAAAAAAYVPPSVFDQYFGPTPLGLFFTVILATVLEVCSEGTAPLAFEIYRQSGAFGNVFAFLMGGVVTDYTEIGLVWMHLGRRSALWMIAVALPQVICLGLLFNLIF